MPIVQQKSTLVPATVKTTDYTVIDADGGTELNFEITANRTVTLPLISTVDDGFNIVIRNSATGAFIVTIAVSGSDMIEGATSITLDQGESIWLRGDDGDWKSISTYLPDGSVTTDEIADGAVDGTKIAMGSDALGDILYYDGTNYTRLPAGTSGQLLKTNGTSANPQWVDSVSSGKVVQMIAEEERALLSGTTIMPLDNTIPQKTEGDEYLTATIAPTSSSNYLLMEVTLGKLGHTSSNATFAAAIFQDSDADALVAAECHPGGNGNQAPGFAMRFRMLAGTTSATTFKFRLGANIAGTTSVNGLNGSGLFGGKSYALMTITEIAA
jgi:hypothetical protein